MLKSSKFIVISSSVLLYLLGATNLINCHATNLNQFEYVDSFRGTKEPTARDSPVLSSNTTTQTNDLSPTTTATYSSTSNRNQLIAELSKKSLFRENIRITGDFWCDTCNGDDVTDGQGSSKSLADYLVQGFIAKLACSFYHDTMFHRYDSFEDTKRSTADTVDAEQCHSQLTHLNERVAQAEKDKFESKDLNLHQLLDTYGRAPVGLMEVNFFWPGMYDECSRIEIQMPEGKMQATRYCVASLTPVNFTSSYGKPHSDIVAFKLGICIPKTCDSFENKNKFQLISKLIEFNLRSLEKDQLALTHLYCVPEDRSPLRSWWLAPKSLAAVVFVAAWVAMIIFATIRYEQRTLRNRLSKIPSVDVDPNNNSTSNNGFEHVDTVKEDDGMQVLRSLSLINNYKSLVGTDSDGEGNDGSRVMMPRRVIDLGSLEGIKVICMCYVIMGHVLMCLTTVLANGRTLQYTWSLAYHAANLMPALAVNAFFVITGLLTAYLLFKRHQTQSFMTSPIKWLVFILYRYLRIMPMYALVIIYCKYMAKFAGSGPHWDYATSDRSPRQICEQESWLLTLLFGANFAQSPVEQCIPAAWYLANDFQFFIVTPIFLATLYKSPAIGKLLLKVCICAGYLAGVSSILQADAGDLKSVFERRPDGFKTYLTYLSESYMRPYNRIPAYLVGLLLGYLLHTYEQNKIRHAETLNETKGQSTEAEPDWPLMFRKHGASVCLVAIVVNYLISILITRAPLDPHYVKFLFALNFPLYHILVACIVGAYILLASTGYGNKFINACLSASFWKPLAKLGLCAVLINVEVINYLVQNQREELHLDFYSHTSLNLLCLTATYVVATLAYLFFESPIKAISDHYLRSTTIKTRKEQKA